MCRVFGSSTRPGIWWFRDSSWSYREPAERQRNAIDRFTGGVRDGALWPQQYLRDVAVDLFIDGTAPASDDDWVRLALLHSLRDLHDGLIAVGPEGAAGYGTAKLSRVVLDGSPTRLAALDPIPSPKKETAA